MMLHQPTFAWLILLLISLKTTLAVEMVIGIDGSLEKEQNNNNNNNNNDDDDCQDNYVECRTWAEMGECTNENSSYMHTDCKRSCHICNCVDFDVERCPQWAYRNNCAGEMEEFMYTNCLKSCKACGYAGDTLETLKEQRRKIAAVGGDARLLETKYGYSQYSEELDHQQGDILAIIKETEEYMERRVFIEDLYKNVRQTCLIRNDLCAYWKTQGQCESDKRFMRQHCAPICQICEELDFQFWCPLDESKPMALPRPGTLNALFERILSEKEFQQYSPKVISMPQPAANETIQEGPWFIEFESFLSEDECHHLIELGAQIGYAQSVDTADKEFDGSFDQTTSSTWRTSSTALCSGTSCLEDAIFQKIAQRIETLTGIPQQNAEHLQLLMYETDDFYKYHHDFIPHHVERQMGPRVLTLFLYLNTVEAGGETSFPDINITVTPKAGNAVLWPNVLDEDPLKIDRRMAHQAMPVEKGLKYEANVWIHQRDWREVAARGCS